MSEPTALFAVSNDGPLIAATSYFGTEHAARGYFFCSINGGAFRLFVPPSHEAAIPEMLTGRHCVITRGWHRGLSRKMVEFLFDDGTQNPYAIHLDEKQFDVLPDSRSDIMRSDLVCTLWTRGEGDHPVMAGSLPAMFRAAPLPCLKPWPTGGANDGGAK